MCSVCWINVLRFKITIWEVKESVSNKHLCKLFASDILVNDCCAEA